MRQLFLISALLILGFGLLFLGLGKEMWMNVPWIYVLGLVVAGFARAIQGDGSTPVKVVLVYHSVPAVFFILFLNLVSVSAFDGVAEFVGCEKFDQINRFSMGCRALVAALLAHTMYLWLDRSKTRRRRLEYGVLLLSFFALVFGLVAGASSMASRQTQRGETLVATILEVETIDLKGGPIPRGIGRPAQARYGEFIIVFTLEFNDHGVVRRERIWSGEFYEEKRWVDMIAAANPAGSQRELLHVDAGGKEAFVLFRQVPPEYDR